MVDRLGRVLPVWAVRRPCVGIAREPHRLRRMVRGVGRGAGGQGGNAGGEGSPERPGPAAASSFRATGRA